VHVFPLTLHPISYGDGCVLLFHGTDALRGHSMMKIMMMMMMMIMMIMMMMMILMMMMMMMMMEVMMMMMIIIMMMIMIMMIMKNSHQKRMLHMVMNQNQINQRPAQQMLNTIGMSCKKLMLNNFNASKPLEFQSKLQHLP
jgi:endonuclease/exonuclease/phosphatase (EEP) superfamily protein YafD